MAILEIEEAIEGSDQDEVLTIHISRRALVAFIDLLNANDIRTPDGKFRELFSVHEYGNSDVTLMSTITSVEVE